MEQGIADVPEGKELHARRPQGRVLLRRHRRQPGRRQDQGAGAGRARQGRHHPRAARRLRAARDHRLHRAEQDAAAQPRRRRGHDAAPAQPVLHARLGDLRAGDAPDGATTPPRSSSSSASITHLGGLRLRPRADGRLPADLRGCRRQDRQEAVAAARRRRTTRPIIAQIGDCDGVCQGFAGSNPLRFMKQYAAARPEASRWSPAKPAATTRCCKSFGDEAVGLYQLLPLHARPRHRRATSASSPRCRRTTTSMPGFYSAGLYVNGQVVEAALQSARRQGRRQAEADARRCSRSTLDRHAARAGQVRPFRQRRRRHLHPQARQEGATTAEARNKTVKTYPNVSQFWTYDEKKFLAQPVYSRDYPPLKP